MDSGPVIDGNIPVTALIVGAGFLIVGALIVGYIIKDLFNKFKH
jgi:hypothetical protein